MKRTIIIDLDDSASPKFRKNPARVLKQLIRTVGDQINWGDTERRLQDKDGNQVGFWRLAIEESVTDET